MLQPRKISQLAGSKHKNWESARQALNNWQNARKTTQVLKKAIHKSMDEDQRKAEKREIQRRHVEKEIRDTEIAYVKDLETMLKLKETLEKNILAPDVSQQIFLNVDALYQINRGLAKDLNDEKKTIGEVYLGLAPFLKLYAFYCENHDAALDVVSKLKKKKKDFASFDEELSKEYNGLYLKDFLIKPVQRICKYPLLFRSLIECIPEDTDYWKVIDQLKGKINDIVRDINSLKDNAENFSAINHYVQCLVNYPGNLLDSLERKFIREGVVQWNIVKKSDVSRLKKEDAPERTILVFNDKIILCKAKKSSYLYKGEVFFKDIRVLPLEVDSKYYTTAFVIDNHGKINADKTNALFFDKPTTKDFWFKTIKTLCVEARVKQAKGGDRTTEPRVLVTSTSSANLQPLRSMSSGTETPTRSVDSGEDTTEKDEQSDGATSPSASDPNQVPIIPVAPGSPQPISHVSFVRTRGIGGMNSPKGRSSTVSGATSTPSVMLPGSLASSSPPMSLSSSSGSMPTSPPLPFSTDSLTGGGLNKKRSFRRARGVEALDYSSMSREELEGWCRQLQEENLALLNQLKAAETKLAAYTGTANTTGVGVSPQSSGGGFTPRGFT